MNQRFLIDKLYRNSMFCETLGVVYSKDLATVLYLFRRWYILFYRIYYMYCIIPCSVCAIWEASPKNCFIKTIFHILSRLSLKYDKPVWNVAVTPSRG
jgi:hypothetical protein